MSRNHLDSLCQTIFTGWPRKNTISENIIHIYCFKSIFFRTIVYTKWLPFKFKVTINNIISNFSIFLTFQKKRFAKKITTKNYPQLTNTSKARLKSRLILRNKYTFFFIFWRKKNYETKEDENNKTFFFFLNICQLFIIRFLQWLTHQLNAFLRNMKCLNKFTASQWVICEWHNSSPRGGVRSPKKIYIIWPLQ